MIQPASYAAVMCPARRIVSETTRTNLPDAAGRIFPKHFSWNVSYTKEVEKAQLYQHLKPSNSCFYAEKKLESAQPQKK